VRVGVELRDGRRFSGSAETPRGSDQNFASDDEIVVKYERLASAALPAKRVSQLRDAVLQLETLKDAGALADLMRR
jgi:hypothetical protein